MNNFKREVRNKTFLAITIGLVILAIAALVEVAEPMMR